MARAWIEQGRFPSEILALPRGERALLWASYDVQAEANKPKTSSRAKLKEVTG